MIGRPFLWEGVWERGQRMIRRPRRAATGRGTDYDELLRQWKRAAGISGYLTRHRSDDVELSRGVLWYGLETGDRRHRAKVARAGGVARPPHMRGS